MATTTRTTYAAVRVTRHIPIPYRRVLARLQSSITTKSPDGLAILNDVSSITDFESSIHSYLGPHNFMQIASIDHTEWIHLYGVHTGKAAHRIIFGNPIVAITMMKQDLEAGLFVPVEVILIDLGETGVRSGTNVAYLLPSSMMVTEDEKARREKRELLRAATALDNMLELLWTWVESSEC